VAANASYIGIEDLHYARPGGALWVRAEEHSLEDVITHLLRNAQRHRLAGTPIELRVAAEGPGVELVVRNQGPAIPVDRLERIFEYGVTGRAEAGEGITSSQRGQGLFVARTYMAKMGGTIRARNVPGGVEFVLGFLRGAEPR
jgi:two-component system OmpR family sensor kinase